MYCTKHNSEILKKHKDYQFVFLAALLAASRENTTDAKKIISDREQAVALRHIL